MNDVVLTRLPIGEKLVDIMIFDLHRQNKVSGYFRQLYTTLFLIMYHGLFRVGEVAVGPHTVKAKDVYLDAKDRRAKFVLYTSKTHGRDRQPQEITVYKSIKSSDFFCPVKELRKYSNIRPHYVHDSDPYFVYENGTPLGANDIHCNLRKIIDRLGLDKYLYDTHSFRIGKATDLFHAGENVERIKKLGWWRSNAVYQYLR